MFDVQPTTSLPLSQERLVDGKMKPGLYGPNPEWSVRSKRRYGD